MLYLYHSNDLELLKELLLHKLQEDPAGPFEQEAILVQSQGMSHWLKLQLAQGLGVTAQVEFPLPSKFIWRVFNALKPDLPSRTHFDKQVMAWKLMQLLPELAEQEVCAPIAHYLQQEDSSTALLKRYQLAQNIADTFDQYLIYRPQWLLDWEAGSNSIEHYGTTHELGVHAWQPELWRALLAHTPEQLIEGDKILKPREHRARVHLQLENLVQTQPQALQQLPKRLFVFGIATLPKVYWQVLQAISSQIEVHFYLLNPCNEFAGEIVNSRQALKMLRKNKHGEIHLDVGNPLLASWGKLGREFLRFVQDEQGAGGASNSGLAELDLFYWDEQRTHLLAQIQQDIFNLKDRSAQAFTPEALLSSQFKQPVNAKDGSVRLVSAHSPLRELQRLYDQILYWLETDPSLQPRDIVVMVPDINQYAPYIDAVFASHKAQLKQGGEYRIPWAIADQSLAKENPIIEGFLSLLKLPDSRFLHSEIMDLLSVPAIAQRFELTSEYLHKIQQWLIQAEIRWGLDDKQRGELGLPEFQQNSWRQGLKQLLLGAILPNQAAISGGYQGDLPVFAAEGNEAERLGKLIEFIDQLEIFRGRIQSAELSISHWQELINDLLAAFFAPSEEELSSVQSIRAALESWREDTELANFNSELTGAVVSAWFDEHLGQQAGWQRFLAGPVNFCSLMPMRSIPFKAVCMLGMNDSDYPRRTTPMGFDLMQQFPQVGDRARREDDRYLFLEAVCSAQDYLYLSYRGHEVRDNSVQQPSVLVAELKDYLAAGFCLQSDLDKPHTESRNNFLAWLEESLPLQPYHALNFAPEHPRGVPSFQQLWGEVAQAANETAALPIQNQSQYSQNWLQTPLPLPEELDTSEVQWRNVLEALENPPRFFVRRRLQAYLSNDWVSPATAEPFVLDRLQEYGLKSDWLARVQAQPSLLAELESFSEKFSLQQQHLGHLPVGAAGQIQGAKITQALPELAQQVLPVLAAQGIENRVLDYQLNGVWLRGELNNCYADASGTFLLFYRVGKLNGRFLLRAWLELLFASLHDFAAGEHAAVSEARCYGVDGSKNKVESIVLQAPPREQALELLEQALTWYWRCWQEPIAHLPDALKRMLEKQAALLDKKVATEKLEEEMRKEAQQLYAGRGGLSIDEYLQRCLAGYLENLPDIYPQWLEEFGLLIGSLLEHIRPDEALQ